MEKEKVDVDYFTMNEVKSYVGSWVKFCKNWKIALFFKNYYS